MASLESAIAHFRTAQAELFRSTVEIKFASGTAFDPITGAVTTTYTTRATTPALVRPRSSGDVQAGEEEVTLGQHEAKFPVRTHVEVGDLVVVTSSTHDQALIGKTFNVTEKLYDDWQICRRVVMEANEG